MNSPRLLFLTALLSLAACAPTVQTVRMGGVFPPRPSDCPLELSSGSMMEMMSTHTNVGMVNVRGEEGEAANSPRILALVKPEACALGGDTVLVSASMDLTNGVRTKSNHSFMIFRAKTAGPQAPQKF